VVVIGHGRSDPKAVGNAIRAAVRAVRGRMLAAIREGLAALQASASLEAAAP
jgi:fatty acid/phospholipid biosynthesis enzyme